MRDSVSVNCQFAFDFVIDGAGRNISVAVVPLGCGDQIDYFTIQFVPFCRVSPAREDRVYECSFSRCRACDAGNIRGV